MPQARSLNMGGREGIQSGMSHLTLPLLVALMLPAIAQQPRSPRTLAEMRDRYRPLLIFAPANQLSTKVADQVELLRKSRAQLIDRQVMMVPSYDGYCGILDTDIETIVPGELQPIRRRFHIHPNDFTVILLGKDGGEKFRSNTAVTIEQLNHIIDAMPMRRSEMRAQRPH